MIQQPHVLVVAEIGNTRKIIGGILKNLADVQLYPNLTDLATDFLDNSFDDGFIVMLNVEPPHDWESESLCWFDKLLQPYLGRRLVVVSSDPDFCTAIRWRLPLTDLCVFNLQEFYSDPQKMFN